MHYQNALQEQREDLEMICLSKNGSDEYINLFAEGASIIPTSDKEFNYADSTDPILLRGILKHKAKSRA